MKSGVICLYKEKGFTSHDAVAKMRKLFGTKKVGHTGTLDPEAEGVLPILIGNAVKACDLIRNEKKVYRAKVRFGIFTDTEDIWGKTTREDDSRPEKEEFEKAMLSFLGESMQIPPMMSAVKVGGRKLYEYAREGKVIERPARKIEVFGAELLSFSKEEAELRLSVSKGTYIRTLLCDICAKAGSIGAMSALEREQSGIFTLEKSVTLAELEAMSEEKREEKLIPTEEIFAEEEIFELPQFFDRLIANGCAVSAEKLNLSDQEEGTRFRLYQNNRFFALGEMIEKDGEKCLYKIKNFPPDEAN